MVLCQWYFDPREGQVRRGLDLLENTCILPHHETFRHSWVSRLGGLPAETLRVGIDEQTGAIDDGPDGGWRVYGRGSVTLYRADGCVERFDRGQFLQMDPRATRAPGEVGSWRA
jgi:hypothetical protein